MCCRQFSHDLNLTPCPLPSPSSPYSPWKYPSSTAHPWTKSWDLRENLAIQKAVVELPGLNGASFFPGVGGSIKGEHGGVGMHHGASSLGVPHLFILCWNRTGSDRALDLHYSCSSGFMPGPQTAQMRVFLSIQASDLRHKLSLLSSLLPGWAFCGGPVDTKEERLFLLGCQKGPGRAEMNAVQKRGNMACFVM